MFLPKTTQLATSQRRGNVAVAVAISLILIFGIVALSVDGGLLLDKRRQAQSASDAAALAAASELYANWFKNGVANQGLDVDGNGRVAALAAAAANGYDHGKNGCQVTVNIPPTSGPFKDVRGHVEITINQTQPRYFSTVVGTGDLNYGSRSVARGRRSLINNAIICLDPNGRAALDAGGNGSVSVTGSPIHVNSSDMYAMSANGNGTMTADKFTVNGYPGYVTSGGASFTGQIVPSSEQIPDPLAYLPVPDPRELILQSHNKTMISGGGNRNVNLYPGVYKGGVTINGGNVNLAPGIYYMDGGGFTLGGQGSLRGTGVMIYNAPQSNSDTISLAGGGEVVLSPMTSGPYQGVLIFQDRTSSTPVSISGSSGVTMTITGAFYAAGATLNITGNGDQQTIGSQYISYRLVLGGNGTYNCTWKAEETPGIREIMLVE